ncbi:MAG: hypothetical protein AUK47_18135 [Deltaproteobacteria bacterium CG2_30_63_29]|nr:MAG: hypothetical protein AUK47_18135 [Deltaproteobacteria bacterium CG2_30_63_29]PJB39834.1 MAG: hypothetical protein CO108_16355 [Deltaproteobacteria bacterium CG_4_9_14_3_um_filter_63_12]
MKTTLDLPSDLIREAKLRAVIQGRTLEDLVADLLRQGLGMAPPRHAEAPSPSSMVEIGPDGLPVICCRADAPASRVGVEELLRLEQPQPEEDERRAGLPV